MLSFNGIIVFEGQCQQHIGQQSLFWPKFSEWPPQTLGVGEDVYLEPTTPDDYLFHNFLNNILFNNSTYTVYTSEHHLLSLVILWSYPPSASLTLLTAILHPCPATETTAPARRLSSYPSVLSLVESERLGPVIHYLFVWHCDFYRYGKISERLSLYLYL